VDITERKRAEEMFLEMQQREHTVKKIGEPCSARGCADRSIFFGCLIDVIRPSLPRTLLRGRPLEKAESLWSQLDTICRMISG
jgi:hypothetical protein